MDRIAYTDVLPQILAQRIRAESEKLGVTNASYLEAVDVIEHKKEPFGFAGFLLDVLKPFDNPNGTLVTLYVFREGKETVAFPIGNPILAQIVDAILWDSHATLKLKRTERLTG